MNRSFKEPHLFETEIFWNISNPFTHFTYATQHIYWPQLCSDTMGKCCHIDIFNISQFSSGYIRLLSL